MGYSIFHILHLFAALMFVGTVFFEVLVLDAVRGHLPARVMLQAERAIGLRVRRLMPWAIALLFGSGLGLVWLRYLPLLAPPWQSSFGVLLGLKILLAASVLGHFLRALYLMRHGRMTVRRSRAIHLSVFAHVVGIVLLAKGMFYLTW